MKVAVLGASNHPERYSYRAVKALRDQGHTPFPVHPALRELDGLPVFRSLREIPERLDVISVYLAPANSDRVANDLEASGCPRVIFNPGAENPALEQRLRQRGVKVEEACTLVLLRTGQF